MSMKNIKFTGLLTRKKAVRYLIYVLFVCAFAVFVIKLNQVEKTELVVRTGQTFEKAKVVKGALESSGTDFALEMTRMMEAQRAYSYALKMVQTSDEVETTINSLR